MPGSQYTEKETGENETVNLALSIDELEILRALAPGKVIDEVWLSALNKDFIKACNPIKSGSGANTEEALEIKAARERVFSRLGMTDEGHDLFNIFQRVVKVNRGAYPSPLPLIQNARLFATHGFDIIRFFKTDKEFMGRVVDIDASQEAWEESGLQGHILEEAPALISYRPPFLKEKMRPPLRLARVLNLQNLFGAVTKERFNILADDPKRQIAIARAALEFYVFSDAPSAKEVAQLSLKSPEAILLAAFENDNATIADARSVSRRTGKRNQRRVGRYKTTQDRREMLLEILNDSSQLHLLGSAALNSYFLYRPVTKVERSKYIVASLYDKEARDENAPRLNRSHFEWLERLVDDGTKLDNNWLRQANLLAALGSKIPRKNKEIVNAARRLFFEHLGLGTYSQKESKFNAEGKSGRALERFANPLNFISRVELLSQYNIHNIDEIAQHSFRIFYESQGTLVDKIETITAQGFDLTDSSIQKYLATVLRQKTREIKNGAMAKQFRKPADKKKAASSHRKQPPRKTAVRSIASKETPTEQPANPLTLENWRHLHSRPEKEDKTIDKATLSVASTICTVLESSQSPDIMAKVLNLQALSQTQLGELATFIDKKYIAGENITMGVIRKELKNIANE